MIDGVGYILEDEFIVKDIVNALSYIDDNYTILSKNSIEKYKNNYSMQKFILNFKNILIKGN